MKSRSCLLIFIFVALSLTSCGQQKSSQEIAETVKKSIVLISYQNERGSGTGFIVEGQTGVCTVLTARHVVEGHSLNLQTNDERLWKSNSIQTNPYFDLAVVTFKSVGEKCSYPSLNLGDSESVKVYDTIYISGFPQDDGGQLDPQSVIGSVSSLNVKKLKGYQISYNAKVENGMSGAPVLDASGKVIAVHGLLDKGFPRGIPINIYKQSQSNLVNQPTPTADSTKQENKSDFVNQPIANNDSTKQENKSDFVNQLIANKDLFHDWIKNFINVVIVGFLNLIPEVVYWLNAIFGLVLIGMFWWGILNIPYR